jgi:hypothetical protein
MGLNYTVLIGIAASSITFIWTVYQYIDTRKREQNLKEFENYHKLIKELVQPENGAMYVDRQSAIIYELRHFKRYYSFSYRTLVGLKEKWEKVPDQFPRLLDELNRTIDFLKDKK